MRTGAQEWLYCTGPTPPSTWQVHSSKLSTRCYDYVIMMTVWKTAQPSKCHHLQPHSHPHERESHSKAYFAKRTKKCLIKSSPGENTVTIFENISIRKLKQEVYEGRGHGSSWERAEIKCAVILSYRMTCLAQVTRSPSVPWSVWGGREGRGWHPAFPVATSGHTHYATDTDGRIPPFQRPLHFKIGVQARSSNPQKGFS